MSNLDEATENPNEKMPAGQPIEPDVIVQEEFEDEETAGGDDPAPQEQSREEAGLRS